MTIDARLRALQDRFIASWGQMGSVWGISRTMAEVHALLYITAEPACTDDIMERLQISRGNASMSLRALVDWGVVTRAHRRGDRKEYFVAEQDVWAMFRAIVRERMKREVDPLLAALYEIRESAPVGPGKREAEARRQAGGGEAAALERLDALLEFFETTQGLTQRFVSPAGRGLEIAATLLGKSRRKSRAARSPGGLDRKQT
jgi:DNA-binding transcriptional regulator GbsR (MarR family)